MITKRYTWNFNENAEVWENDCYDTIEECIQEAKKENELKGFVHEVVYVGETEPFRIRCYAESVLEQLEQDAYEQCGEVAQDWRTYDYEKDEDLLQLSDAITKVVTGWLEKKGRMPEFYGIRNVEGYWLS